MTRPPTRFNLTEKNLERQEEQNKIGAASDRDLDQASSDHAQAAAEYTRTQARLKALGAAPQPKAAIATLLTVTAPGARQRHRRLSVAPGNMINDPTQPLMTIADLSTVWVTALVAEKDLRRSPRIRMPRSALRAYPGPGAARQGAVRLRCDRAGFAPQQDPHRLCRTPTMRSSPTCSRP